MPGTHSTARADDAAEAELHWELAQALVHAGRHVAALDHLLEANRLAPNRAVSLAIARVYRHLHRDIEAFNAYEVLRVRFSEELSGDERAEIEREQGALAERVAVLDVHTVPDGATIYVDRIELGALGTSPRRFAVSPGEHVVIARLEAHHDATITSTAEAGVATTAALTLSPLVGSLHIESSPTGASVRSDTGVVGTTPLDVDLPVGTHTLRIESDGYVAHAEAVTVRAGERTEVHARLQRAASDMAILTVRGSPEGASVWVDDTLLGRVPLTRDDLRPGPATLEVRSEGMEPYQGAIVLEAGAATRLDVTLRPPDRWIWEEARWIGWGITAALAIAGASMGGAALAQRDAFFSNPSRQALGSTETFALVSDVLLAGTGALAVTLVILEFALEPPRRSDARIEIER